MESLIWEWRNHKMGMKSQSNNCKVRRRDLDSRDKFNSVFQDLFSIKHVPGTKMKKRYLLLKLQYNAHETWTFIHYLARNVLKAATRGVKKGVLRNFAKSTGKHLYQSPFFNKVAVAATWPFYAHLMGEFVSLTNLSFRITTAKYLL